MGRRFAGAGLSRRDTRGDGGGFHGVPTPLQLLGSRLHWWHRTTADTVTHDGTYVQRVDDRGPNAWHAVQNGSATGRHVAATLSLTAGRRLRLYWLIAQNSLASNEYTLHCEGSGASKIWFGWSTTSSKFNVFVVPNGESSQNVMLTSPAGATSWSLWSLEFLAAGLSLRRNGAATSPALTGTGTSPVLSIAYYGLTANSGGAMAECFCGEDVTDTEDAALRAYVAAWSGVG